MDTLPDEIKLIIIKFLPLYKLITDNTLPIFNEYIMNYINTKLLTDNYINGCLYKCELYRDIIDNKLIDITKSIAKKFMEYSKGIVFLNFNNPTPISIISVIIIFKFTTVGKHFNGSTDDILFKLSNSNMGYSGICSVIFYGTSNYIDYNEYDIQNKLYCVLTRNIDLSDTTVDIKKMEMIKINYPSGFSNYHDYNEEVLIKFI